MLSCLYLLLHLKIIFRYLLLECHNLGPNHPPQSPHFILVEKMLVLQYRSFIPPALFHFFLNRIENLRSNNGFMMPLHIILWYLSIIFHLLMGQIVLRIILLQKGIAFILLIGEYAYYRILIPCILPAGAFNLPSHQFLGNRTGCHPVSFPPRFLTVRFSCSKSLPYFQALKAPKRFLSTRFPAPEKWTVFYQETNPIQKQIQIGSHILYAQ